MALMHPSPVVQAEAGGRTAEEARADLLTLRQELDSTKAKMDVLAERLAPPWAEAAAAGSAAAGAPASPPAPRPHNASPKHATRRSAAAEALPRLKTRAVPGAVLAGSLLPAAGPAAGLPSLAPRGMASADTTGAWATPPDSSASMRNAASGISFVVGGGRPDRRRASPPDREAESKRDAAMIAHQTRWQ